MSVTISIGMPVYNGELFIREALDSLLAQTFTDFELIISDNASIDATECICLEYAAKDTRIRYFRQVENKGALANFQAVLDLAVGDFFMWAAADDKWASNWIEHIYERVYCEKNVAGFGELLHINKQGNTFLHPANKVNLEFRGSLWWRKLLFFLGCERMGKANLFYSLYPREALKGLSLQSYCFDFQILYALLDKVEYIQVDGAYLYKRVHSGCDGSVADGELGQGGFLKYVKTLRYELQLMRCYSEYNSLGFRLAQTFLFPVKLFLWLKFHLRKIIFFSCGKSEPLC